MKIRLEHFHLFGGGGTNRIYKCPIPPQGSTVADLEASLVLDIGGGSYKKMVTDGVYLYLVDDNYPKVVQKRNCSDLTLVSSTAANFNGSDSFSAGIVGITVFNGILYVLQETRIVKFDTETMLYIESVTLPDIGESTRQAIDNDGVHAYITVRPPLPR